MKREVPADISKDERPGARRERPRHCRATEQRYELPPFQLIELHSIPPG
jgi:hypothetical protein